MTARSTLAVVLEQPERLVLEHVVLAEPGDDDVIVDIDWSGISTGTERLLWSGRMPAFPGMGYPLVPGYESTGRIVDAGTGARHRLGETVFVPGARCFGAIRGLFGGAARRVVVPSNRAHPVDAALGERAVLLALAATAQHAIAGGALPDLVVGHGVLGRMIARLACAVGASPVVWETSAARRDGGDGYAVVDPSEDPRRDYRAIYDASGDAGVLDALVSRLAPGGEIVLAGFYERPIAFAFAPAFMREARLRVAAQWHDNDLVRVRALVDAGTLSLDDLITHREPASAAASAYAAAFGDPCCLKMVLDWRGCP